MRPDSLVSYRVETPRRENPALVAIELESPYPGGAVFPYPIRQQCGRGKLEPGDWSRQPGLNCYSGGMWYRREIGLDETTCRQVVALDLGEVVSTAEVFVNGQSAGLRMAAPWKFDLTGLLKPGKNRLEIRVYNTAATHYISIPTMYRGDITSGLLKTPSLLLQEE